MKSINNPFRHVKILLVVVHIFFVPITSFGQNYATPQLKRVVVTGGITDRCSVKVQYQQIANFKSSPVLDKINSANRIHVFATKKAQSFPDDNIAINHSAAELLNYYYPGMPTLPWYEVEQTARVIRGGKYIVFVTSSTLYSGGASASYSQLPKMYSLATGNVVHIPNLTTGYWWGTLRRNLYKRCHQQLEDLFSIFSLDQMPQPTSYELTDKGVAFIYQPYEVAPGAAGTVSVEFSDLELKQMGVPVTW